MKNVLNTAIIGFGLSGRVFHAPFINELEHYNLSTILTTNKNSIKYISDHYKGTKVVKDINDIMSDASIDLVIISTPNRHHYEFAKLALKHNKHVIVEKPFTVTSKEAEHLIQIANESSLTLTVFHNRRYDSDFKTIHKVIQNNLLGKLVEYEAHFDRFRNYLKEGAWKEQDERGSGILYDLGPHLIDQAIHLFGQPKKVFGDVRKQRTCSVVDDYFEIILYYDRFKVTLKAGMLVKESMPRYILLGENGSFIKYGMDVQENALRNGLLPSKDPSWGEEPESIHGILNTTVNGLEVRGKVKSVNGDYRDYFMDVYYHINGKKTSTYFVTAEQAKTTIKLIEQVKKSSDEGIVISV